MDEDDDLDYNQSLINTPTGMDPRRMMWAGLLMDIGDYIGQLGTYEGGAGKARMPNNMSKLLFQAEQSNRRERQLATRRAAIEANSRRADARLGLDQDKFAYTQEADRAAAIAKAIENAQTQANWEQERQDTIDAAARERQHDIQGSWKFETINNADGSSTTVPFNPYLSGAPGGMPSVGAGAAMPGGPAGAPTPMLGGPAPMPPQGAYPAQPGVNAPGMVQPGLPMTGPMTPAPATPPPVVPQPTGFQTLDNGDYMYQGSRVPGPLIRPEDRVPGAIAQTPSRLDQMNQQRAEEAYLAYQGGAEPQAMFSKSGAEDLLFLTTRELAGEDDQFNMGDWGEQLQQYFGMAIGMDTDEMSNTRAIERLANMETLEAANLLTGPISEKELGFLQGTKFNVKVDNEESAQEYLLGMNLLGMATKMARADRAALMRLRDPVTGKEFTPLQSENYYYDRLAFYMNRANDNKDELINRINTPGMDKNQMRATIEDLMFDGEWGG